MSKRILLVDDEPHILTTLTGILEASGYISQTAEDGDVGLKKLMTKEFDIAIVDQVMTKITGMAVLQGAEMKRIRTPIIILTGYGTAEMATEALRRGAVDFIQKPLRPENLITRINKLFGYLKSNRNPVAERVDQLLSKLSFNPNLRLKHLSDEVGLNSGYVSDLLKAYWGMAFLQRLAYHRVRHAKVLIEFDEPLKAIPSMCGFKNQPRMTEAFSRFEKMSPKKYQILISDRRKNL